MAGPTNFVAEFERSVARQIRFGTVAVVVAGVVIAALVLWMSPQDSSERPTWIWIAGLILAESAIFGFLLLFIRNQFEKVRTLPRAMRSRLASATVNPVPTLVFDNGLVFTWARGAEFRLFGRVGGGRANPSPEDVRHALRTMLRMKMLLHMSQKRGPDLLRARLEHVRKRMQSRFSWLSVAVPRPGSLPDPRRPAWIATLNLGGPMFKPDAERILAHLDELAFLLEDAVVTAQTADSTAGRRR